MAPLGSVAELRRYPVKSLAGELLTSVDVDDRGLRGDRRWAVVDADGKLGSGKSSRRFRRMEGLLDLSASYDRDEVPVIAFPDGRRIWGHDPAVHAALSDHVGRPVCLRAEEAVSHFDEGPLHLVTTAAMTALARARGGAVSPARMRSNLLVEVPRSAGTVEDAWVGRTLALGPEVLVRIGEPMRRCAMVDLPQVGLPAATDVLETIHRLNDGALGVVADVVRPGSVSVHDPVELVGS